MHVLKSFFSPLRSGLRTFTLRLRTRPLGWGVILLIVALFYLFYFFRARPGMLVEQVTPLEICAVTTLFLGAWLKARQGALLVWLLTAPCIVLNTYFVYGANWNTPANNKFTLLSLCTGIIIALGAGQVCSISARLGLAYDELQGTHDDLEIAHTKIQKQALTDPLTALPNHRAMMDQLEKENDRARRFARPFSVLFLDLDHFKALNDGYGHAGGDAALYSFGQLLHQGMRGLDTVGRWGGEEFLVILPETTAQKAQIIAERLRQQVSQQLFAIGGGLHLTCSIGVASYPEHGSNFTALINAADHAMYAAKRLGRNQVRVIDDAVVKTVLTSEEGEGDREEVALQGFLGALTSLLEQRDPSLSVRSSKVADLAHHLSKRLGITEHEATMIKRAGQLYLLGEIGLPDAILRKPTPLTEEESQQMGKHSVAGAEIVAHVPALRPLAPVIRAHHEWWNGTGYPDQLQADTIPLAARVIAVADAYQTMTEDRSSQKAYSSQDAVEELQSRAGTQFDPLVVDALIGHLQEQAPEIEVAA